MLSRPYMPSILPSKVEIANYSIWLPELSSVILLAANLTPKHE